ncbi:neutral amino acid transporter [Tulasnella sp. 427]|nr:neutral amino acid transporter [Tulasnella sp. 427]
MSQSPSQPVPIGSPTARRPAGEFAPGSFASASQRDVPVSASPRPDIERLREQFHGTPPPNIPARTLAPPVSSSPYRSSPLIGPQPISGTPQSYGSAALGRRSPYGSRPGTPRGFPASGRGTPDPYAPPENGDEPPLGLDSLPDEEKARVLRRHLVSREERARLADDAGSTSNRLEAHGAGSSRASISESHHRDDTEPFPVPFDAPGGDITHNIYKWQSDARRAAIKRSKSVVAPRVQPVHPAFEHIHEPGGFRRNYLLLKASEQGVDQPPILTNFVDFLYLFGHFAGEDLEEDEEDDLIEIEDEDFQAPYVDDGGNLRPTAGPSAVPHLTVDTAYRPRWIADGDKATETTPLIQSPNYSKISKARRKRRSSVGPHGDATVPQAVLMLLKSFIGTGVLFLGKAFYNGGMLFSSAVLVFIAMISLHSFLLLVRTKFVVSGSFGDIGGILYGNWMRNAILSSIVVSQLGFVSAYLIFVAENLQAFILAVTKCSTELPIVQLILVQLVLFLPLALVRNLAKLSTTALIADAFILVGLVYIGSNEFAVIAQRGMARVELFNKKDFPLLIGTAVFSFEGIGLIIPITDAMREPKKFPKVLTWVMIFLTCLFGGAGVLSYAAYGKEVQTVVLVNLPQDKKFVQVVQFLYSMAILLSAPLQLFPALRILENGLWTRSGKTDPIVKWQKNGFRVLVVIGCTMISWAGAKDLDKFVSFVGSFCCIPLCFIYPAMLHLKACAKTRRQRLADWLMIIFGVIATFYTSIGTIKLMFEPPSGKAPQYGHCAPPNN